MSSLRSRQDLLDLLVSVCDPNTVSPIEKNGIFIVITKEEFFAFVDKITEKETHD